MWIYKITNIQNNKVYIGQTIRPIEQRFHRHLNDVLNNIIDTHFARAIRKYGKDNFIIEQIDYFDTVIDWVKACGIKSRKTSISTRLNGQVKSPFKKTWNFEYYDE